MVDLMMWLVIAALLLAAAIQGIGYYQQAAYAYQAKNDLIGAQQWAASYSSMNDGVPTGTSLSTALTGSDLKLSSNNEAMIASLGAKYCIGIKSLNITDTRNIFYSTSDAPNDIKQDTAMPASCGTSSAPAGGSGGTGGSGTSALAAGTTVVGWASQDLSTMASEETAFGVSNGMLSTYADFVSSPAFPSDYAAAAAARKSPLLVAWEPYDWSNSSLDQPSFRPANIATGSYDSQITSWLTSAEGFAKNSTIMVRFAPEMNDAVRPWSVGANGGNTAADYIAMWQHVYNIKKSVAPDVVMVWNPLVAGSDGAGNPVTITSVFPGASYVDMLALDGFNWGPLHVAAGACGWQSYDDVFKNPITEIKSLAGSKPWGIAETASASQPDSDFEAGGVCNSAWGWAYSWPQSGVYYQTTSDWITQAGWDKTMVEQAHASGATFVNLFNVNKETDWRLNSTPAGTGVLSFLNGSGGYGFGGVGTSDYVKSTVK